MNIRTFSTVIIASVLGATLCIPAHTRETGQYESQYREVNPQAAEEQAPPQPGAPGSPEAEAQLRQLQSNPYAQALLLNQLAQTAIREGNYATGLDYLEKLLALNALSDAVTAPLKAQLPALYAATNQFRKFTVAYEAKAKTPEGLSANEWLQLGNAYIQLDQPAKALRPLEQAIKLTPNAPEDWYRARLAVLQQLGRSAAVFNALQEMLRVFPDKSEYWLQVAQLQAEKKQWRAAVSTLDLAYRQRLLDTNESLLLYARLTHRAGWPHRAGALLQTWIEQGLLNDSAARWEEMAGYWLAAHEHGRAIQALTTAIERNPRVELYLQLGQLHMDVGEWASAINALDTALASGKVRASLGRTHLLRGMAHYQLGQYDLALTAFTQANAQADVADAAGQWLNFIGLLAANNIAPASLTGALRNAAERGELSWASDELNNRLARPQGQQPTANSFAAAAPQALAASSDSQYIEPRLGRLLTPMGATQAGTSDQKIPPWQGGITPDQAPSAHTPGQRPISPFADEKPLFTVTGDNLDEHIQWLSEGHIALLRQYPSYRLPVYSSHRTAAYPQAIYDATASNASTAKLIGTEAIKNAKLGTPFPRPNTGAEVIWNHKMRFRGSTRISVNTSAVVSNGQIEARTGKQKVLFAYGNLTEPVSTDESNRLVYVLFQLGTERRTEGLALAHEPSDHQRQRRKIWVGGDGTRGRLITVPFIGYDFPINDGGMFIDQLDMYNGAFDYYAWKLVGKQTMLIPYNSYSSIDPSWEHEQLLGDQHYNPEATRYELHRVWVVDAQLRGGENHKLPRRRFYVDEDSWTIVMVDNYDADGNLHQFQEAHSLALYDQPFVAFATMLVYDLLKGEYSATGMTNEHPFWEIDQGDVDAGHFTPNAARRLLR